jgi:glycine dehydrogenase subunit 1
MPFIPHTSDDVTQMLAEIGSPSIEALFDEIPENLRTNLSTVIPEGLCEMEISQLMQERAQQDIVTLCFIGAGAYEHYIPAAVWDIVSRGEFMTAYTPYQAEASQGTLQLLYEYQTMMASLMGMDVSNASLYDGASALAEAALMAIRSNRHSKSRRILVPKTLHPHYLEVLKSILTPQCIELVELCYSETEGKTSLTVLEDLTGEDIAALIIPQPNFFGVLEDVDQLTDWAHANGALAIAVVNPLAMALLKEPIAWGEKGADIVCGEAQPLGVPLASGGPYVGFMCCKEAYIRQMPGRIVGKTVDLDGKPGFALTLQAREQHIRRSKATSNICTNQGLLVTAVTLYLSLLGPEGLHKVALRCHTNMRRLLDKLAHVAGIKPRFSHQPYFHEVLVRLTDKRASDVLLALSSMGIEGGYATKAYYPELGECLLICVTETKSDRDLDVFCDALSQALSMSFPLIEKSA